MLRVHALAINTDSDQIAESIEKINEVLHNIRVKLILHLPARSAASGDYLLIFEKYNEPFDGKKLLQEIEKEIFSEEEDELLEEISRRDREKRNLMIIDDEILREIEHNGYEETSVDDLISDKHEQKLKSRSSTSGKNKSEKIPAASDVHNNVATSHNTTEEPDDTEKTPDSALLIKLKDWRAQKAGIQNVPLYLILSNSTLEEIARTKPISMDDLAVIKGMGEIKMERYGKELLRLIITSLKN